jgi:hypothetical protein
MINAEPPCASMAEDVCTMLASVGILALALLLMWAF